MSALQCIKRSSKKSILTAIILFGALLVVAYHFTEFHQQLTIYYQGLVSNDSSPSVDSFPKCQQNMSAEEVPGFSSFPRRIQDYLYYRHCRHFPMILDVRDKCGGVDDPEDVFLLLVIKSSPVNYDRREALRKTWAEERSHMGRKIRRIFIFGTWGNDVEKQRTNKQLELEQREHNDILQWDFNKSHINLTLKQVLFLEWMDRNCRHVRFLLNGDDDILANTDKMVEFLAGLSNNTGEKHLFTGNMGSNDPPMRNPRSKYYVPVQAYKPRTYPTFIYGGSILLSGYTASVIYRISDLIPIFALDDVYFAMCLAEANLKPTHQKGFMVHGANHLKDKPCEIRKLFFVHNYRSAEIQKTWHQIHEPNLNCSM